MKPSYNRKALMLFKLVIGSLIVIGFMVYEIILDIFNLH